MNNSYYPLLTESSPADAVILANGEYPTHSLPLGLLRNAPYVVCCDGAADEYIRRGHHPDAIVGDGDSISPQNRERFAHILFTSNDQETNDQTKAVRHCMAQGKRHILILGATGCREDHTLGNISLLMDYMEHTRVEMVTNHGVFTPVLGDATFQTYPGQQLSIINFGATHIRGEGLRYPLRDFTNWWQGTLNEATGNAVKIYARGKYLVFREGGL